MKLIEAMKQIKELVRKQADLRDKIGVYCAHLSLETPVYGEETRDTVKGWLQSHEDIAKEIVRLKVAIQRTNLATVVTIKLGDVSVSKRIAEWILRRGNDKIPGLANADREAWAKLTDRNLREGIGKNSLGAELEIRIVRNFDPKTRDQKIELYRSEPSAIDAALETVNAITDLLE